MSAHVIRFDQDGTGHCLWSEAIPLAELGTLHIEPISRIDYNNLSGFWEVKIDGTTRYWNRSRNACIDWEINHFNQELAGGTI